LHKFHMMPYSLIELALIEAFKKKTSLIAKYTGLNQHYIRNI